MLISGLTSHLGDSGMKNNPGINIVQGKVPANEVCSDVSSINICNF